MQIKLKDVSFIYSPKTPFETLALSNITLSIGENEFIGLIGHTGSGKSTFIQLLNGLLFPTKGKLYIDGKEIREYRSLVDIRRKIGVVFQYPEDQFFEENVFNEVAFGLKNMGLPDLVIEKRVKKVLELVDLDPKVFCKRSPFHLSGGEKRRLAIAVVLAMKPDLIIFDEPGVGLDPKSKEKIFALIHGLYKEGTSIILVSHDMDVVASFSNRVLVMNKGKIILDDTPYVVFIKNRKLLESINLDIPDISKILFDLKKCGYDVDPGLFNISEIKKEIERILNGLI